MTLFPLHRDNKVQKPQQNKHDGDHLIRVHVTVQYMHNYMVKISATSKFHHHTLHHLIKSCSPWLITSTSNLMTSVLIYVHNIIILTIVLSLAFGSAPFSSSSCAMSQWPLRLAQCSGVFCSYTCIKVYNNAYMYMYYALYIIHVTISTTCTCIYMNYNILYPCSYI